MFVEFAAFGVYVFLQTLSHNCAGYFLAHLAYVVLYTEAVRMLVHQIIKNCLQT